jgi:hypothetical protein
MHRINESRAFIREHLEDAVLLRNLFRSRSEIGNIADYFNIENIRNALEDKDTAPNSRKARAMQLLGLRKPSWKFAIGMTRNNQVPAILDYSDMSDDNFRFLADEFGSNKELPEHVVEPVPARKPHKKPTRKPRKKPARKPSKKPTRKPSKKPTRKPSKRPTRKPSKKPTRKPSKKPTRKRTLKSPRKRTRRK